MSESVVHAVARHFLLMPADLKGKSRHKHVVEARIVAAYIMFNRYGMTYSAIARRLNRTDHSTALYYARRFPDVVEARPRLQAFVREMMEGPALPPLVVAPFEPRIFVPIPPQIKRDDSRLKYRASRARKIVASLEAA